MTIDLGMNNLATSANEPTQWVIDSSTANFQADVIDMSKTLPVLVDFWAPWCGPCKQLGPLIEQIVASYEGKVRLVKINVDENQALSGQMGVQSIPAVFAFAGGQPVDGFMGALPETQIRAFIDKTLQGARNLPGAPETKDAQIKAALLAADEALLAGDLSRAEQIFMAVLQHDPANDTALLGLADLFVKSDRLEDAETLLVEVSDDGKKLPLYTGILAAIALTHEAQDLGPIAELETRLAQNEEDHQARYDLAIALNAKGLKLEAAQALVHIMRKDRSWHDDAARVKLLELFDAWGPTAPATLKGRRLLSTALFS